MRGSSEPPEANSRNVSRGRFAAATPVGRWPRPFPHSPARAHLSLVLSRNHAVGDGEHARPGRGQPAPSPGGWVGRRVTEQ